MKNVLLGLLLLSAIQVTAQRKTGGDPAASPGFPTKVSALQAMAVLECVNSKKEYAYFYSLDGRPVITQQQPEEVTEIALIPGSHEVKLKFQPKGELVMTVDSFEDLTFLKGHRYLVKWEYKPGRGEYPTSTYTARLRMWIVDAADDSILAEKIVNGKGDLVAGN